MPFIKIYALVVFLFFSLAINAQANDYYEFPSAFSPNGDQQNDTFSLVPGSTATLEVMSIFNRWGELVFDKARDGKVSWDGNNQGKAQPTGTYLMNATVKLPNGELKIETRSISLVR